MSDYITGEEFFDQRSEELGLDGLDAFPDAVNGTEFEKRRIPMVVACTGCGMTMAVISHSVRIDPDGYVWCAGCVDEVN